MAHPGSKQIHFLIVTFPAQGHLNPALQFAKRVISFGAQVTLVTTVFAHRRMLKNSTSQHPDGLTFAPFSDGYDDNWPPNNEVDHHCSENRRCGMEAVSGLIQSLVKENRLISCVIYTLLTPWAGKVARNFNISSCLLWIQPATVFDIYYYYFSGHEDAIVSCSKDSSYTVKLPGLPVFKSEDLPSVLLPSNPYTFGLKAFEEQYGLLLEEPNSFQILVNTFDELEPDGLRAVDELNLIGVGPLIPSAFLDGKDPSDKSFGGDLLDHSKDYIEWLDSKGKSSVIYVSFGSFALLADKQMEELVCGLVDSERPFLWVIRSGVDNNEKYREILETREHKGMIVEWCSQVEVLNHPSVGCFVTHCGWNSTLETLAMGVPVVAFPQWTDQLTNAKLIEDVWKIGVRVRPNEEDNIVTSEEIVRCIEEVMEGEKGEELRKNAQKWKELSREAVKEGGSSHRNLQAFVEKFGGGPVHV